MQPSQPAVLGKLFAIVPVFPYLGSAEHSCCVHEHSAHPLPARHSGARNGGAALFGAREFYCAQKFNATVGLGTM